MNRLPQSLWRAGAGVALAACIGLSAAPVAAQYADLDRADWQEDAVPPPPAYSLDRRYR